MTETTVAVPGADGEPVEVDRVFVPPQPARAFVADDLVLTTIELADKGATAAATELVTRPRRLLTGTTARRRGQMVIEQDGAQGTGWITLAEPVAESLAAHEGERVVVLVVPGEGGAPVAQAVAAGPYPAGTADATRARAVPLVLGGAAPSVVPGGPAAVGLDPQATETTHVRITGQLAAGRRGAAAGLDRSGPVPGENLVPMDRRDETCVTVDAFASRDLDDAVGASWDRDPDSPVWVAVHITDVAGDIGLDSPADQYARTLAATAYLASGPNAPMLDPSMSEGAHSLVVGQDRAVLSARFAVLPDGRVDRVTVEPAWIRSRARLSYRAVERWLAGDGKAVELEASTQAPSVERALRDALEASRRLSVERDARLTLEELFDQAELTPTVVNGELTLASAEPHAEAYRLIERLMVAANEAVGGWLVRHEMPALYRAHEGIDPGRRERLRAAAELAGASLPSVEADDGDPDRVTGELLAEIDRLDREGRIESRDLLISTATSSTARATYEPDPHQHRGLASEAYVHFTSPLRRYADLVVHRQVRAALAGEPPPHEVELLRPLSDWLGARAGALARLEGRERADLWALLLEQGEIRGAETAVVTGLTPAGLRIRVPRLGLPGFLTAEDALGLGDDERAKLETDTHGLTATSASWRVGVRTSVRYAGLDEIGRASWTRADTAG
ncbi:ribonuclease catalytic domain-containing protein [Egibacter rhizosphaerae]|uniref:ribonuclease catalytic domain-containing protein n=1 Tax=Egibacter rhizosphaerae TaxID=1670831 RepID=UPI0013F16682|nr:ribonuclease catalytic domain-containing protein [Egibacter rhizosphaerae]